MFCSTTAGVTAARQDHVLRGRECPNAVLAERDDPDTVNFVGYRVGTILGGPRELLAHQPFLDRKQKRVWERK